MEQQQQVEKSEQAPTKSKGEANPVLRLELTVGTMALGLFIDLIVSGPGRMLGSNGASIIALFVFLATFVWNMGVDTIVWVQKTKREWEPYLPQKATLVQQQGEEALPQLTEEKAATTMTRKLDDEVELPITPAPRSMGRRTIDLASDVQVDKSDLAGKAIFICGIRRHGKTTLGARLAEQLGKHYIPLFIPCLEGDYLSLADVLPRAIMAGHSSADRQYADYDFMSLDTAQEAYELGHTLLKLGYQVILDMASYAVLDQAIAMQINIIRGMFHFANSNPDDRVPAHVFLDEAQRYLPQTLSDSVILDKAVLGELLRAYMDIIAIGGKRGIAPVILTQRFAQVNKKIMAQSEVFFLMRQTNDGDLDRCMEYVNSEVATKEQIAKFQPGQGVYIASDGSQLVTHFKQRESSGKRSSTPQADNARRYATMPLILDELPSRPTRSNKTAFLPEMEKIRTNPAQHPEPPTKQGTAKLTPELQMVMNVYKPGMGYRELGKALGVGKDKAGELLNELKEHRLI